MHPVVVQPYFDRTFAPPAVAVDALTAELAKHARDIGHPVPAPIIVRDVWNWLHGAKYESVSDSDVAEVAAAKQAAETIVASAKKASDEAVAGATRYLSAQPDALAEMKKTAGAEVRGVSEAQAAKVLGAMEAKLGKVAASIAAEVAAAKGLVTNAGRAPRAARGEACAGCGRRAP